MCVQRVAVHPGIRQYGSRARIARSASGGQRRVVPLTLARDVRVPGRTRRPACARRRSRSSASCCAVTSTPFTSRKSTSSCSPIGSIVSASSRDSPRAVTIRTVPCGGSPSRARAMPAAMRARVSATSRHQGASAKSSPAASDARKPHASTMRSAVRSTRPARESATRKVRAPANGSGPAGPGPVPCGEIGFGIVGLPPREHRAEGASTAPSGTASTPTAPCPYSRPGRASGPGPCA